VVGKNNILTATHVIYNPDRGGWAKDLEFYFGADYNHALGYFESYDYRLTSGFRWNAKAGTVINLVNRLSTIDCMGCSRYNQPN